MLVVLDANRLTEPAKAHEYLKEKFDFPDYYGKNLDALHDCLTDMDDVEVELVHDNHHPFVEQILQIMEDEDIVVKRFE